MGKAGTWHRMMAPLSFGEPHRLAPDSLLAPHRSWPGLSRRGPCAHHQAGPSPDTEQDLGCGHDMGGAPPHVRAHPELLSLPQPSGQGRRLREPQFHWPGQGRSGDEQALPEQIICCAPPNSCVEILTPVGWCLEVGIWQGLRVRQSRG